MFNETIPARNYKTLKARLTEKGARVCVEQSWYDNGEKWLDVSVSNGDERQSRTLVKLCYLYSS